MKNKLTITYRHIDGSIDEFSTETCSNLHEIVESFERALTAMQYSVNGRLEFISESERG